MNGIPTWDKKVAYDGAQQFLNTRTVGFVLRAWAPKRKFVDARTAKVISTIKVLQGISLHPRIKTVKRIDVWIPMDQTRKDHDCGLLRAALLAAIKEEGLGDVYVHELHDGDLYCRLLNRAVSLQGCHYSGILSTEARENITPDSMARMYNALHQGAWVTGLAFGSIGDYVTAGYIMNGCAIWKVTTLQEFGGFDLIAEQRRISDSKRHPVMVWQDKQTKEDAPDFVYDEGGMEHMAPLLRMAEAMCHRKDGNPFIAPIPGDGEWETPNPENERALYLRFKNMLGTKWARMLIWAELLDLPMESIPECVMPEYRRT